MDSDCVTRRFTEARRLYGDAPCGECRGSGTITLVYEGVVVVSCPDCGGATRIGALATSR
ncbi:hypothetical protein [Streptomyces sp. NPDC047928]|uniref:hypothetical protein n=1 Tax=unclassified Streptomyces TaxID=2593676 RepID=UPI00371D183C